MTDSDSTAAALFEAAGRPGCDRRRLMERAAALITDQAAEIARLRARLAEGEEIVAEAVVIHDRHKSEIARLRAALERKLELDADHRRFDLAVERRETHQAWLNDVYQANEQARAALATDQQETRR